MKRTFIAYNLVLILLVIIAFLGITFSLTNYVSKRQTASMLEVMLDDTVISYNLSELSDADFVKNFESSKRRISIIDEAGNTIADSMMISTSGNQLSYPELMTLGKPYSRYSESLKLNLMYIAQTAENGKYVRVAVVMDEYIKFSEQTVLLLVIISITIVGIAFFMLKKTSNLFLKPIKDVSTSIKTVKDGDYQWILPNSDYEEINGLYREINQINEQIVNQIKTLELRDEELKLLLSHMQQGILVIGSDQSIILSNEKSRNLLKLKVNSEIIEIRHKELYQTIAKATQVDTNVDQKLLIDQRHLTIKITSVNHRILIKDKNPYGVLVILVDETERILLENNKRDFFANVSHELKTPLTAIKGSAELIHYDMVSKTDEKILSKDIIYQVETMNSLIQDMLELSRLETRPKLELEVINLKSLLELVLEQLQSTAISKSIKIAFETEDMQIKGVISDFRSLFKNLIENAIKYNVDGGMIDIKLYKKDAIYFVVKDTGIGIPKDQTDRIFERFYQVNKTRSKLQNGTGLGLSIVKHVVSYYKGSITVLSELGVGTTFTVMIPT
ncbi:two-component system phosphate regulon sensor histidine kinase PhoR [Acholeplasma morum]|uniref:sensor histidine kinase n=1 Tax=Paracholeplasma morum TaxID=264637 RepID=UPI00195D3211|nr:ATP-binding protein [Paracholeplasma morum]MBM7454044.1 two-component system phosphate regulon sensor histidine kinase PhoR [Paracholeplasma morum]